MGIFRQIKIGQTQKFHIPKLEMSNENHDQIRALLRNSIAPARAAAMASEKFSSTE